MSFIKYLNNFFSKNQAFENNIKYFCFTVDVEAMIYRASDNHVEKLIWGRFSGINEPIGIPKIIEILNSLSIKGTFYVDLFEIELYGLEEIKKVTDYIQENGHEIQLHAHIDDIPLEWFKKRGIRRIKFLNEVYDKSAKFIVD